MVAKYDETSKDNEIDKLMALISLSFKKIYKPTNNNLRTSSNTSRANQDNSPRINRGTGYEHQRFGNVAGARETVGSTVEEARIQLNAEQADWRDDTDDDELEDQELEAHYMYMAQLQEVSSDAADSGPIFDVEPLQKVSNNDHYNVFSIESAHPEQSKFVHDTYPIEQDAHNVIIDSLDMSYDREGCYNDNPELMLAPESDKVIRLEKESRSKSSDLIRPFDYEKLNNLYDLFIPQREKSSEQRYFSERSRLSHTSVNNGNSKESFNKQATLLEKQMDESILWDKKYKSSIENFKVKTEYYYADHMNAILGMYTELDEVTNLQCDYLELLEKCECLENELSKSKMMSKSFEALQKHATNLVIDLQQFTAQTLPPNKKSILKNTNVLALGMYKLHTKHNQARTSQLPHDSRKTNKYVSFSTGVIPTTSVSRPRLKSNPMGDRVMRNNSQGKKQEVEDQRRNVNFYKNKTSVTACNDSLNAKTLNVNSVCATYDKCMLNDKHDMCVLNSVEKPLKKTIALESNQKPRNITRKLYERVSVPLCQILHCLLILLQLVEIVLFIVDSGCSKHMMGNLKLLINFAEKFLGTVKFRNDQIAPILGYGDLVQGAVTIKRVYYVEGLNHNLFSVGQFCDADLEVALRKSTCYIRDLKGNDLLTGSRGTDLYSITLQNTNYPNPICLMAKATSSQAWLWHRRLSHLNFDTINLLSKNDIVVGLPKLKFVKDHLCSFCELGKAKRKSFHTKITPSSKRRLQLLHMDLCGLMQVANINGKRYVLVIVDDYSRYTWTQCLRSKDETPEVLIDFLRLVQRGLQAQSRAYKVFNKRTRVIMESIHVNFDELPQMASDHVSSDPVPEYKTVTTSNELDLLFSLIFDELLNGSSKVVSKSSTVTTADAPNQRQQQTTTPLNTLLTPDPTCQVLPQAPTVASNENMNQAEMVEEYAQVENDEFIYIFCTPVQDQRETSSHHVDSSNMHTFYQHHPSEHRWTKDHSLEQVIGNPSQSVRTRRQLQSDGEMYMFALIVSRTEPKNIKKAMADSAWIESMQEELYQFDFD
nr:hypothetical protein [Tanacetum cinerariifolium]